MESAWTTGVAVHAAAGLLAVGFSMAALAIIRAWSKCSRAARSSDRFEARFWSGADLARLQEDASQRQGALVGMEAVFAAGFGEYARLLRKPGLTGDLRLKAARRTMRAASAREVGVAGRHSRLLARIATTAAYVGTCGTVAGLASVLAQLDAAHAVGPATVLPALAPTLAPLAFGLALSVVTRWASDQLTELNAQQAARLRAFADELTGVLEQFTSGAAREAG